MLRHLDCCAAIHGVLKLEAIVIREGFTTPALSISGLEAGFWEGELLIVVSDENYQ